MRQHDFRNGRGKKNEPPGSSSPSAGEPFFNMPPATKYLVGSLLAVFFLLKYILPAKWAFFVIAHMSFIPARFTGGLPFSPSILLSPFTYMWLHGGWTHLLLNVVMLLAFGAGIERWLGSKKMIAMMLVCGLTGALFHFAFYPRSYTPVIGASGGISGLFAVILVMINRGKWRGGPGEGSGILPFAVLWVVISIGSAFIGGFGNGQVAWAVHIGGFLGGFLVMRPYLRRS